MTYFISEKLQQFDPASAEKTYGEIYQHCQNEAFAKEEVSAALSEVMVWVENGDLLQQSYGLLFLGGIIDSGKLTDAAGERLLTFFIEQLHHVENFDVLDEHHRFVHLVSHFAYFAASYCEKFEAHHQTIVEKMVALFLRAPKPIWCGEELLVARLILEARLSDKAFKQMLVSLKPQPIMQSADKWDGAEASAWQRAMMVEAHKRQLLMALQCVNENLGQKSPMLFRSSNKAIFATKFG